MYHPRNLNRATLHRQKNVDKKDMKQQIGRLLSTLLLATFSLGITAGVIQGTIIDKQTKEPPDRSYRTDCRNHDRNRSRCRR